MSKISSSIRTILLTGVAMGIAFSLPIYPSSWAKPSAIKVMAQDFRNQVVKDFAKGEQKNLKFETEGSQSVLTPEDTKSNATYISPVMKSNFSFHAVGLHWKNRSADKEKMEESIQMKVRVSKDGVKWSDWMEASASEDEGPSKQEETFSNLIFTDKSNYVQYSVDLKGKQKSKPRVKDIKITVINSQDGEKVAEKTSLWQVVSEKASGVVAKPNIVSRQQWGADESTRFKNGVETWPREYHSVTHLFVHHTDTEGGASTDPSSIMRGMYYYHTVTKGWGDIGYNAIIGSDGKIYEGRKGQDNDVLTPKVVGAGTYGFNKGGFSVAMMGNYQSTALPAAMRASLVKLLTYEASIHGINPTGKANFVRDYEISDPSIPKIDYNVDTISGHKDSKYTPGTLCPGTYIYNNLPNIRTEVKAALAESTPILNPNLKRLAGVDRYATSATISEEIEALGNVSDTIIIARADLFADALSGGTLAAKTKSPILLTDPNTLRANTQAEIQRRKPTKAIILGGTGAVSTNVENQLKSLGVTNIQRISGIDRYAVSAATSEKIVAGSSTDTAFIASGLNFPDALSASSIAAQKGSPILLVRTDFVPPQIKQFIEAHPEIKNYYIVGGSGVVSDNIKTYLQSRGTVTRIDGINRFETAVNIAKQFNMSAASLVFADGTSFPDALSGGPLAAYTGSPILLTKPALLPTEIETFVASKQEEFKKGYILGGSGAISVEIESKLGSYIK